MSTQLPPHAAVLPCRDDIRVFRTPKEFCGWFDAVLERTRNLPEALHREALLHQGDFKPFYEELFPLAMLLRHKVDAWRNDRFRHLWDPQSVDDVEVESSTLPFRWIEITCTNFDADESYLMRVLAQDGGVCTTGTILRNERGKAVGVTSEMREVGQAIEAECKKVRERINQKCNKHYSSKPALLVHFDDYTSYDDRVYAAVERCCRSIRNEWSRAFSWLFAVGARNSRLIEIEAISDVDVQPQGPQHQAMLRAVPT